MVLTEDDALGNALKVYEGELKRMGQLTTLTLSTRSDFDAPQQAAINSSPEVDVVILLEGLIDLDAERARLRKEIDKLSKQKLGVEKRLNNPKFRDRAPAAVIEQNEVILRDVNAQIKRLEDRIEAL